jgi:hypothetical protein
MRREGPAVGPSLRSYRTNPVIIRLFRPLPGTGPSVSSKISFGLENRAPPAYDRPMRLTIIVLLTAMSLSLTPPARAGTVAEDLNRIEAFRSLEQWAAAESLAATVLARLEGAPDVDSLTLATALFVYGEARYQRSEFDDTIPFQSVARSLEIRSRRLPANHPDIATSMAQMGVMLIGVDNDSSLTILRRALEIRLNQPANRGTRWRHWKKELSC